jgi:glycosyltransferase involved in cell wall biosynthesis
MHIALDARYLNGPDSGIGTYVENLIREGIALDPALRFTLVSRQRGLAARFGERVDEVLFDAPPRSLRTLYTLRRVLRGRHFDLFHGPFNVLPHGIPLLAAVTVHDAIPLEDPRLVDKRLSYRIGAGRFWRRGLTSAVRRADLILTVSEASRDLLRDHFPEIPEHRFAVTPNGADPFFFAPPLAEERRAARELAGGAPYVLVVGQGSPRKNHERAVQAFLQAFSPDDPMRLVLVRRLTRRDPELRALLATDDARRRVIQLGYVDRPTLRALYAEARVFFFPSLLEGFGLPLIEAMAAGTVCVTTASGAPAEVAGDAAVTASPLDVDEMAAALRLAQSDGALRERLIASGAARARSFTYRRCAEATLEAYARVLAAAPAGRQAGSRLASTSR